MCVAIQYNDDLVELLLLLLFNFFLLRVFLELGLTTCVCVCVPPGQVSQLYDVVQKWDAMSSSVPQVVQRLVAVKELHEQGNAHQLQLSRRPGLS